jgi:hypothetical protein
MSTLPK